ncbi:Hypothetical predicted protein [Marmota monax]|uniref:Uncharacterized protein n=1 Tax=Marmota monax TaxID=9995 RepID=A0A5E4C676_MARMO|nr:Hypothetical predicted protein [Marmota monax]
MTLELLSTCGDCDNGKTIKEKLRLLWRNLTAQAGHLSTASPEHQGGWRVWEAIFPAGPALHTHPDLASACSDD